MHTKTLLPYNGPNNALRHAQLWRQRSTPPHQEGYNFPIMSTGTEAVQVMEFLRGQKIDGQPIDVGYCAGYVGFKQIEVRDRALTLMAETTTDSAMPAIAAAIRAQANGHA